MGRRISDALLGITFIGITFLWTVTLNVLWEIYPLAAWVIMLPPLAFACWCVGRGLRELARLRNTP
jgi:hypothetical protein